MIPKRETTDRIYEYINVVQEMNDNHWKVMGYTFGPAPEVDVIFGKKYAKVVCMNRHYVTGDPAVVGKENTKVAYGQTTVHSFVNMENGDILKGSWKAPVKNGVRGNINADDVGADRINEYGPIYLKGPSAGRKGLI
jgi:hypothetical protein